jgi:hypothetical protein
MPSNACLAVLYNFRTPFQIWVTWTYSAKYVAGFNSKLTVFLLSIFTLNLC